MAADIALSVAGKITELLFEPIQRELGYLLCFNNNIQDLQTVLRDLKAAINDVQAREDAEERSRRTLGEGVKLWIEDANGKITEAENVMEEKAELQKGCFSIKWCPNLKLRFSLGRKGKKLSLVLNDLLQRGGELPLTGIDLPMPPINMSNYNGDVSGLESRTKIVDQIIEMLLDKETRLIGICGMGGIGKTTLAKQVLQKVHDSHKNLFDFQVISTVSRLPNFSAIQQQVVEMLGGGSSLKEIDNETLRAEYLRNTFNKKKVVVLLDDVWEEFDLNAKGFPLKESDGCKIIYTSRTQGLWLGERTINKKEISLDLLSNKEASDLFRNAVDLRTDDIEFNWKNGKAIEIVKECKGLPLALSITGGALLKKNKHQWEHLLNRMKNHHDQHSKITAALRTSYDFLEEDNEKLLFLICCLFQEDENIPIEILRRYAAGLHLFKDTNHLREIRVGVHTAIDNLIMKNLLIEVDDLVYMERAVKMHDVVRDVGISIAKQVENGFNFLVWDGVNNLENDIGPNTKMISILIQNRDLKVPHWMEFRGSKLELLQLGTFGYLDIKIPDNFFQWMDNLKVLAIIRNNVGREFSYFSSFSYLAKLKMLSLDKLDMRNFNVSSIANLRYLEILSLRGSTMKALPNEISELTNLRLLDLTGNRCFVGNDILSKLTNLQELYMWNSFVDWSAFEENNASARLIELNCLHKLWRLELEVSNIKQVPRGVKLLSSSNLKEFKIIMSKDRYQMPKSGERQLLLENVKDNFLYELEAILENKVTHLHLRNTSGIWEHMHLKGFLKDILHIVLQQCQSIITIFPPSKFSPQTFNAEEIYGLNLGCIKIYECNQMRHLFPISILRDLKNLQVLVVKKCEMLEDFVSICKDTKELKIIEFKALETLGLHDLCRLECFCKGIEEIHFHKLKTLKLEGLKQFIFPTKMEIPYLERLVIGSIPSLENLCNFLPPSLQQLSIFNCDALKYVFSGIFARSSIFHLQNLYVRECKMLKGIVYESMDAEEKCRNISFEFPNLLHLNLYSLDELASFVICDEEKSQNVMFYHNQVSFPCLENLTIEGLPKINYILGCKGRGEDNDDYDTTPLIFPILKSLRVGGLSNLIHIYQRNHPELGVHLFQNMSVLDISHCGKLRYLFPENIGRVSTKNLFMISIAHCPMMEVVMKNEEENEELGAEDDKAKAEREGIICHFFPHLEILNLINLPGLRRFCDVAYTWTLVSLHRIEVFQCPKLEALCPGNLNSPRLHTFVHEAYQVSPENWRVPENWKVDLNAPFKIFFKE